MRRLKITNQIRQRENESLERYLKEISREQMITAEEEAMLAQRVKEGDAIAIEKLTKANLRFVVSVAKQYQHCGLPLNDLINEGNIGLIKAAKRFDASRGFKLISYAVWHIRQSILQALGEQKHLVRLPFGKMTMINKIRKATEKMEQQFQREPSYEELGNELGFSPAIIKEIISVARKEVSIDAPLTGIDDLTLSDLIADKDEGNKEQKLNESLRKGIESAMSTLAPHEAQVLSLYFGLNDQDPLTFEGIAVQFGLSRERIRQIKEAALRKLKYTCRKALREYL